MTVSPAEFEDELAALGRELGSYLGESRAGATPVLRQPPMRVLAETLGAQRWLDQGGLQGPALAEFFRTYLAHSTRLHHPGYMAHQVATPHVRTALAHLVDGFTNNAMNIYEMGPAASTLEYVVINRMLEWVGWTPRPWPDELEPGRDHGAGFLTHGGSLANLTALLTARAHAFPSAWAEGYVGRPTILAPAANHYSVERAAGIMGLGTRAIHHLETDARDRIVPERIAAAYRAASEAGGTPFVVVANACDTAVGLYDPLREIAAACRELGLWLHVDGAHGAGALVSPKLRHLLDGVAEADSLVWDAHKLLATPSVCAAVLFRNHRDQAGTFRQEASYLFHDKDQPGFDFIAHTVECTKAGLGLRLFTTLASLGPQGLIAHVERLVELGQLAARLISARPGFSLPVEPQTNIVCFRYGDDDERQLAIRRAVLRDGDHYLSTTMFRGRRYLRLALMNPDTNERTLVALLDAIAAVP